MNTDETPDGALLRSLFAAKGWGQAEAYAARVAAMLEGARAGDAASATALLLVAHREPWYAGWEFIEHSATESPIERLMVGALHSACVMRWMQPVRPMICPAGRQDVDLASAPGTTPYGRPEHGLLLIVPQFVMSGYRLDALLVGEETPRDGETRRIVVGIECDGHAFHERTKEQAERDKRRDRTIQLAGVPVLRFTGTEIWRDAIRCAHEALAAFDAFWLPTV